MEKLFVAAMFKRAKFERRRRTTTNGKHGTRSGSFFGQQIANNCSIHWRRRIRQPRLGISKFRATFTENGFVRLERQSNVFRGRMTHNDPSYFVGNNVRKRTSTTKNATRTY